jgi:hypothetical protein
MTAVASQVPYVLARAKRHVDGGALIDIDLPLVRDAGPLASWPLAGARPGSAPAEPRGEAERDLRTASRLESTFARSSL